PLMLSVVLSTLRTPPSSTIFPYTTLFRSYEEDREKRKIYKDITQHQPLVATKRQKIGIAVVLLFFIVLVNGVTTQGWFMVEMSRSEEHTSELQSRFDLVCRLLLEKKNIRR